MGTLVTVLAVTGPNGATGSRTRREPLSEASLLRAGTALISQEPNAEGWTVVALRAAL